MPMKLYDALIVGSGFAGSLLARILARRGWDVLLLERRKHPRFALGESTTPLANLALERLSRRFELPELYQLATHGRWLESFPEVRRGLKRGFSFYGHQSGRDYRPGAGNERRLLVAASPEDRVADTHWLREDVDQLFAKLAVDAGVELLEKTFLERIEIGEDRAVVGGRRGGERVAFAARLVLDASGTGGFLASNLPVPPGRVLRTRSSLLYAHFDGVVPLPEVVTPPMGAATPYAEDRAAVHHLLDEGWLYSLRFDDGRVSAGLLVEDAEEAHRLGEQPGRGFSAVMSRYPSLAASFSQARAVFPVAFRPSIQYRLSATHGPRWTVLPSTYGFVDPLYSTGIAWSLLGVERLADILLARAPDDTEIGSGAAFSRYGRLLELELDQIDRLVAPAYGARSNFALFAAHSLLYFALVSFEEATQRLCEPDSPEWRGFLGAENPSTVALLDEAAARIRSAPSALEAAVPEVAGFQAWVRTAIAPFDIAGLGDPRRNNLHPVDLEVLVESASRLGLTRADVRAAMPRLRGMEELS